VRGVGAGGVGLAGGAGSGGPRSWALGGNRLCPAHTRIDGVRRNDVGSALPSVLPFVLHARPSLSFFSFVIFSVRTTRSRDRPGRRAKGVLAMSRHRADSGQETDCTHPRHDLDGSHASNE